MYAEEIIKKMSRETKIRRQKIFEKKIKYMKVKQQKRIKG